MKLPEQIGIEALPNLPKTGKASGLSRLVLKWLVAFSRHPETQKLVAMTTEIYEM